MEGSCREEGEHIIYGSLSALHEDEVLDREIEKAEIGKCIFKLKNSKTGGNDSLVGVA